MCVDSISPGPAVTGLRLCCRGHDWAWVCSHWGEGRAGRGGAGRGLAPRMVTLHSYSGHNGHNNVVLIMLDATSGDYFLYFIVYFTFLLDLKLLSMFYFSFSFSKFYFLSFYILYGSDLCNVNLACLA